MNLDVSDFSTRQVKGSRSTALMHLNAVIGAIYYNHHYYHPICTFDADDRLIVIFIFTYSSVLRRGRASFRHRRMELWTLLVYL